MEGDLLLKACKTERFKNIYFAGKQKRAIEQLAARRA
jgi:hypothetical protein